MYKIANQVIDFYDDLDKTILKKVAQLNPNIMVLTEEERSALPDDEFALNVITKKASRINKFPIDSRDSTWLSNQYFQETHERLPKIAAETAAHNIKVACTIFNLKPSEAVEKIAKDSGSNIYYETDIAPAKKLEVEDLSKFAEIGKICGNETFAKYAFATPKDIEKGAEYFDQYCDKIRTDYRHKYAAALQRRAGELGVTVKGKIEKYAGNSYGANVDAHLSVRKDLVQANPKFVNALTKMASMKNDMTPVEFAELLHGFDKRANLVRYYNGYLTNPYEATFSGIQNDKYLYKKASIELMQNELIAMDDSKHRKIAEYLGKEVADSLKTDGDTIFNSLPNDAKEVIASVMNGTL